jgi:hypothetical protein
VTTEEQYAVIGKAHADLKAAKEKLRALNLAAQQWGLQLSEAGKTLATKPYAAGLNGESPMPTNLVPPGSAFVFDRNIFDADKFRDLTNDIRETMALIQNLEHKLG